MGVENKINNVWRSLGTSFTKINGVWRESDIYTNLDGVWRNMYDSSIQDSDIIGFRFVYRLASNIKHPEHPHLKVNKTLPVEFGVTGESKNMDFTFKGVVFRYTNEEPDNEGIAMYLGTMYAELFDGRVLDVSCLNNHGYTDRVVGDENNPDSWTSIKLSNMSVQVNARLTYESFGYYMNGWNSFFDNVDFLDPTRYPDHGYSTDYKLIFPRIILPVGGVSETYNKFASIGISRDMKTQNKNMVGSHGVLDHTIHNVYLNGVAKPFVVEMYN